MAFSDDRNDHQTHSAWLPPVNASEGKNLCAGVGIAASSNRANFGAVEKFFTLSVACVANFDGFSELGFSFDQLVLLGVVGQLGSHWGDRLYSPLLN